MMADIYLMVGSILFLYAAMHTIGVFLEQRVPWVWMGLAIFSLAFAIRGWKGQPSPMGLSDMPDVFIRAIAAIFM